MSLPARRAGFAIDAALIIAALVAVASTAGIFIPGTYAGETANWRLQAVVQDWIDLLLAVPWLLASALAARAGSRRGLLLLAGGLIFVAYSFAIYAFAVRFNRVFLVYCAVFGLSVWALVDVGRALFTARVTTWFDGGEPRRATAAFQITSGVAFTFLWLVQIGAALVRGTPPPELAETGLLTNPVHVIDLGLVLPSLLASGLALWRGRPAGHVAGPVLLAFTTLMNVNVAVLTVALDGPAAVAAALGAAAVVSAGLLAGFFRATRPRHVTGP